jgi:hypothetical protein
MNPIESYFDRIFVIHQSHRTDRAAHMREQWNKYNFTKMEVFEAHSGMIDHHGKVNGNASCTASHRALFEIIAYNRWDKVAIFEDDFEFVGDDPMGQFEKTIGQVPDAWDVLYLGGHFAEPPISRVAPNVIRCGRMHTTSSYAVRWQTARRIAPYLCGVGPIDTLISGFLPNMRSFILDPRIAVQYASFSDLTERESNNRDCMLDMNHSRMV